MSTEDLRQKLYEVIDDSLGWDKFTAKKFIDVIVRYLKERDEK